MILDKFGGFSGKVEMFDDAWRMGLMHHGAAKLDHWISWVETMYHGSPKTLVFIMVCLQTACP